MDNAQPSGAAPQVEEESSLPAFVREELPPREVAATDTPFPAVRETAVCAAPPVSPQPHAPVYAAQLESEKVVIAAPMSFAGSAARIWKLVRLRPEVWARVLLGVLASMLIVMVWTVVLAWYLVWGLWLVPYRIVRRGSRKRKREGLQHRELLAAIQQQSDGRNR